MSSSDAWTAARRAPDDTRAGAPDATAGRSRLIPSEQLGAVQAWSLSSFSPPAQPPSTDFEDLSDFVSPGFSLRRTPAPLPGALDFTTVRHVGPQRAAGPVAHPANANADAAAAWDDPADAADGADLPPGAHTHQSWHDSLRQDLLEEMEAELAERQAQADALLQDQLHEARQAGYQDGYRDGLVALENFKQSYAQQVTAQVGQLVIQLDSDLQQLEQQVAASVARMATELARQVVRSELSLRPALVAQVAQEATGALLKGARQITIALHPDDLELVAQGCADQLQATGARLVSRAGIERGGCLVECDIGTVDARVATRWNLAARALGTDLPWHDADDSPGADA